MNKKNSKARFSNISVIILSTLILIGAFGLGLFIYQKTLKDLEVRAKCPPSVIGVNQAHFKMTMKVLVKDIPKDAGVLDLWLPYPQNRTNQIISNVSVKSPYPVEVNHEKKYGNAILHTRVKNPKKDFEVSINFGVIRQENMAAKFIDRNVYKLKDAGDYQKWLSYEVADGLGLPLTGLAKKLSARRNSSVDKAKEIYDYLAEGYIFDFKKIEHTPRKGDMVSFYRRKKGGSAEFSTMFATLARISGVPAKYISGYTLRSHSGGRIESNAYWAEFFAPGYGWIPADMAMAKKFPQDTGYYFGNTDEWRVELVTGRDIILEPPQKGPAINVWVGPYAEVDGKMFPVGKRVSWASVF